MFFFFQAEDGIRYLTVTGVQTCALPVVPRNIHSPVVGRRWVVIHPARLPVVTGAGVNAEMGPAIRVPWRGGLVAAVALTAAAAVQPDGIPGAVVALIQNDRVADGIGEGALPAASGEPGEGGTAVGGHRCSGDVNGAHVAAA